MNKNDFLLKKTLFLSTLFISLIVALSFLLCSCGGTCTVTFLDESGTAVLKTLDVPYGSNADAPVAPEREGYRFVGWDGAVENVIKDVTVKAVYVRQYSVTFFGNDGVVLDKQYVDEGEKANPPVPPYVKGMTFDGWSGRYTNITEDTVLYARYFCEFWEVANVRMIDGGDAYAVIGVNDNANAVFIPSTYEGVPVTTISANAFASAEQLTNVIFEADSNIKVIGDSAFSSCTGLKSIELPSSVSVISNRAFMNCTSLSEVIIADDVELASVGTAAFSDCASLNYNVEDGVKFLGSPSNPHMIIVDAKAASREFVIPSDTKIIAGSAFRSNFSLVRVVIPPSVVSIGDYAFCASDIEEFIIEQSDEPIILDKNTLYSCHRLKKLVLERVDVIPERLCVACRSLSEVVIGENVTQISQYAFADCTKLESVTFESNSKLGTIPQHTFSGCSMLTEISIPDSVTEIGDYAFVECYALERANFGENSKLASIGAHAFSKTALTAVALPKEVVRINYAAFEGCGEIVELILPDTVSYVGERAFAYCSKLQSITFPPSLDLLPASVLLSATSLSEVTIQSDSIIAIPENAFSGCNKLRQIEIPDSVLVISKCAFFGCSSLRTVSFTENSRLIRIREEAFSYSGLVSIEFPATLQSIYSMAFLECTSLRYVSFKGNEVGVIGGYAFKKCSIESIDIPVHLKTIEEGTFENCGRLRFVNVPENSELSYIGENAFHSCSIANISLPDCLEFIDDGAFRECHMLTTVSFKNNNVYRIGYRAFYSCHMLTEMSTFNCLSDIGAEAFAFCKMLKTVSFGNDCSFEKIPQKAFYYSGITNITIPRSVVHIEKAAFASCTDLEMLVFEDESNIPNIAADAFADCEKLQLTF